MMKTQQYNKTQSITKALKWKEKISVHKERKKERKRMLLSFLRQASMDQSGVRLWLFDGQLVPDY